MRYGASGKELRQVSTLQARRAVSEAPKSALGRSTGWRLDPPPQIPRVHLQGSCPPADSGRLESQDPSSPDKGRMDMKDLREQIPPS